MGFDLNKLIRKNIRNLKPYSSARKEFAGAADIFLDANENSFGSPLAPGLNRYPDPLQTALKLRIAESKGVKPNQIFIGNGSDEAIDLIFRVFCEPGGDEVIICPPTYGMYKVSADINDVRVIEARLTPDFQLDVQSIQEKISEKTKLIFICSPNNPTGNSMRRDSILEIADAFHGIVAVDEAYNHFAAENSLLDEIRSFSNLVVLQTFSKAWGLAGLRVGLAFADGEVIELFNRVKPPYNVSQIAQDAILRALENKRQVEDWIEQTIKQRSLLSTELAKLAFVETVYASEANFILLKTTGANAIYEFLLNEKIVVRNRNNVELCGGCLRITVGTPAENRTLIKALEKFELRIG